MARFRRYGEYLRNVGGSQTAIDVIVRLRRPIITGLWLLCAACPGLTDRAIAQEIAAGQQIEASFVAADEATVSYLIYVPPDYDPGKKWPLHLFLHGRGESKQPLANVATWGPPKMAARGDELPFILVSPQCPVDDYWTTPNQQERLIQLLERVVSTLSVDEHRIVLSGLSMGGYGSWRLAADHPEKFAAVVPICGAGRLNDARRLVDIPIWVWHGDQDKVVPVKNSVAMVEAIRAAGSEQIRFTRLEHIGHNSWSAAYGTPELFQWLSQQARTR